jgi:phosphonate transport system substrate-binding protein
VTGVQTCALPIFEYAGNHTKAALGVIQGRYDIAGLKQDQADKYSHMDLHVIARQGPYPAFALVANSQTLSAERRAAVRQWMLSVDPATRATWGDALRMGTASAHDADYNVVRASAEAIGDIPGTEK